MYLTQGAYELCHPTTNSVIIFHCLNSTRITQGFIEMVHMLVESEGTPPGLKIISCHNIILFDYILVAGVTHRNEYKNKNEDQKMILMILLKMKLIMNMNKTQILKKIKTS